MDTLLRHLAWPHHSGTGSELSLRREWLVTNGLGGYASGTVLGVPTRRYHGLLVTALPAPHGRTLVLPHVSEQVRLSDGTVAQLGGEERVNRVHQVHRSGHLTAFRLALGLPIWRYEMAQTVIEKQLFLSYQQNTVYITYRLLAGEAGVRLKLMPSLHFRSHDAPVDTPLPRGCCTLTAMQGRYEFSAAPDLPPLRMKLYGRRPAFTVEEQTVPHVFYRVEQRRGYDAVGDLWSPGYFRVDLLDGQDATLVASTEDWDTLMALAPAQALQAEQERRQRLLSVALPKTEDNMAAELTLAADAFIIKPVGRTEDAARAHATGDESRTVIAGYHWFTDWGRDTMISLEGLTLATGRYVEAGYILRTFAAYIRDGLLPNLFPEGEKEGLYHTADATLWFFHTLDRYVTLTGDHATLRLLLPKLIDIVSHHLRGTRFGIKVDSTDGLLSQGDPTYPLTWMDAKVEGWIVTPRRGKAVEINALWYNALCLLTAWLREAGRDQEARTLDDHAKQAQQSFNERFWYSAGPYLYDVIDGEDGDDAACRPNQLLAISLRHAILMPERWSPVLEVVRQRLLTPLGLRSLDPAHPEYKATYDGDLQARDAAYHQGTVWAWLIGPFIDAWLKVHPDDRAGAQAYLQEFEAHLDDACIGSISEIFDAELPFAPRGCVAQAWSVAEVLRCWLKTAPESTQFTTVDRRNR
jgi:predicted glycogen debranching enzyme